MVESSPTCELFAQGDILNCLQALKNEGDSNSTDDISAFDTKLSSIVRSHNVLVCEWLLEVSRPSYLCLIMLKRTLEIN